MVVNLDKPTNDYGTNKEKDRIYLIKVLEQIENALNATSTEEDITSITDEISSLAETSQKHSNRLNNTVRVGAKNGINYIKMIDGALILFANGSAEKTIATSMGGKYVSDEITVTFPAKFNSIPVFIGGTVKTGNDILSIISTDTTVDKAKIRLTSNYPISTAIEASYCFAIIGISR